MCSGPGASVVRPGRGGHGGTAIILRRLLACSRAGFRTTTLLTAPLVPVPSIRDPLHAPAQVRAAPGARLRRWASRGAGALASRPDVQDGGLSGPWHIDDELVQGRRYCEAPLAPIASERNSTRSTRRTRIKTDDLGAGDRRFESGPPDQPLSARGKGEGRGNPCGRPRVRRLAVLPAGPEARKMAAMRRGERGRPTAAARPAARRQPPIRAGYEHFRLERQWLARGAPDARAL